jgi:hypothetical protein
MLSDELEYSGIKSLDIGSLTGVLYSFNSNAAFLNLYFNFVQIKLFFNYLVAPLVRIYETHFKAI